MTNRPGGRDGCLLETLTATAWAMDPEILGRFSAILARHAAGLLATPEEVAAITAPKDARGADRRAYEVEDGVAIIPVSGVIAKYSRQVGGVSQPRGTSAETIIAQLEEAREDDEVRVGFLHIESPGGMIPGTAQAGDAIRAFAAVKPIIGFGDDLMASGAYWLGSQADRLYATASAKVGAIGIYSVLIDSSGAAAKEGLRFEIVRSGPHKGVGEAGVPVTDENIAAVQTNVQALFGRFLSAVLTGRRAAGLTAEALAALADGRTWIGQEAADLLLIDGILSLEEALAEAKTLAREPINPQSRRSSMANKPPADQAQDPSISGPAEASAKPGAPAVDPAAIRESAAAEARQNLVALQAAFPDDPAAALEAATKGLTVEAAQAAAYVRDRPLHAAALAEKEAAIKALGEENAKLKGLLGSRGLPADALPPFDAGDKPAAPAADAKAGDDGKAETYAAAVEAHVKAGLTPAAAHGKAGEDLPKAFEAWTAAQQPKH